MLPPQGSLNLHKSTSIEHQGKIFLFQNFCRLDFFHSQAVNWIDQFSSLYERILLLDQHLLELKTSSNFHRNSCDKLEERFGLQKEKDDPFFGIKDGLKHKSKNLRREFLEAWSTMSLLYMDKDSVISKELSSGFWKINAWTDELLFRRLEILLN